MRSACQGWKWAPCPMRVIKRINVAHLRGRSLGACATGRSCPIRFPHTVVIFPYVSPISQISQISHAGGLSFPAPVPPYGEKTTGCRAFRSHQSVVRPVNVVKCARTPAEPIAVPGQQEQHCDLDSSTRQSTHNSLSPAPLRATSIISSASISCKKAAWAASTRAA